MPSPVFQEVTIPLILLSSCNTSTTGVCIYTSIFSFITKSSKTLLVSSISCTLLPPCSRSCTPRRSRISSYMVPFATLPRIGPTQPIVRFPPIVPYLSINATFFPCLAAATAAQIPAGPAPATTTSYFPNTSISFS